MSNRLLNSRYKLIKLLGRGSFGKTYLAEDIWLPEKPKCVVKKLQPTVTKARVLEVASRLFETEAATLKKLGNHDRIPELVDYFEEENKFYLVQQYIEGQTLLEELNTRGIWPEGKVIELLEQILDILEFIHDRGVIHRDIKPANLIRSRKDNKIVLVDFGSVKEVILAQTQVVASSTVAIGTKGYMPTEQARGKPRFSSDIYALGIIAIQALTGIHPMKFEEKENGEIFWQHHANVSPQLAEIISNMTRYNLKDRYQSARDVLKAIELIDSSPASQATPITNNSIQTPSSEIPPTVNPTITVRNLFSKFKSPKSIGTIALLGLLTTGSTYLMQNLNSYSPSKKIVNKIELEYQTKQYDLCLEDATSKETELAGVSPEEILDFVAVCRLGLAEVAAENSDFSEAVQIARQIPDNNSYYHQAQHKIDLWSEKILEKATSLYEQKGQLDEIEDIISAIPNTTPVKQVAQARMKKWKQEIKISKNLLLNAKKAIDRRKWKVAKALAKEVKQISNSRYWNQEAQKIILEAEQQIKIAENNSTGFFQ